MTESFLHYVWQYRLFDSSNLKTDDGYIVEVIKPGILNTGAGPDFFNSHVRIDGTLWVGNVEIHIYSSDWHRHNHHIDPAYDSCILHVVFENDSTTVRTNGTKIPAIELRNKFQAYLWENYLKLIGNKGWIACQHRLNETDENTWALTINKMIHERLEFRTQQIIISLNGNKEDWDECFYQYLLRNFGFQLNAMPFEMLARSLPLKIIRKERDKVENIEALLFGQAGMLNEVFEDDYPIQLQNDYKHFSKKYSLKQIPLSTWKLLRLRPVNFPAIRISQLAALLYNHPFIFSETMNAASIKDIHSLFQTQSSLYWNNHYHFNGSSSYRIKNFGSASVNNLIINTCIPFLYAWGKYNGNKDSTDKALMFLRQLPSEDNHLIRRWKEVGVNFHTAEDSQALIQLKIAHCSEKKCLSCNIGNQLINVLP